MGASKLLITSIVFSLFLVRAWAEEAEIESGVGVDPEASDSEALNRELQQLRSKIVALEYSISDRSRELENRNDHITKMEKIIQEKSAKISILKGEIESLQRKGNLDAEELVRKVHDQAAELEEQVRSLRKELDSESRKRVALEVRASEAKKEAQELNLKIQNLEKANDEQKHIIRKTEQALQLAEQELTRAQLEATSKMKELGEIHGAWLPPWLATHLSYCQDLAETHWKEHAKPTVDIVLQKASEKSAQAQKWLEPHMETVKTKWVPAVKERWVILATNAEPYVEKVSTTTVEVYKASKNTIAPHIAKVQEVADPYFQEAKKISKPYIDHVAGVTKPHVEKARVALKPYTIWVAPAYRKFLELTKTYHHQVEASVEEHLNKYELTKSLATKELAWFMASAILASTVLFMYRLLSSLLCTKMKTGADNADRRPKRRHADY